MAYNSEPAIEDLIFTEGDTINMQFTITDSTGAAYDMTGMQIDMDVDDKKGDLMRSFSSAGTAEITIAVNVLTLYSATPFGKTGKFNYDLQITDLAGGIYTIMKGSLIVQKQITT